jgi:flagellar biosynthetic protein FliP
MTASTRYFARHYRGHGWPASAAMAAAMFVPTFGVVALLWSSLVGDIGTLLVIEHVVMLPSMLVAMLLRRDEYTGAVHDHGRQRVAA